MTVDKGDKEIVVQLTKDIKKLTIIVKKEESDDESEPPRTPKKPKKPSVKGFRHLRCKAKAVSHGGQCKNTTRNHYEAKAIRDTGRCRCHSNSRDEYSDTVG